jgi:hypothetical protein
VEIPLIEEVVCFQWRVDAAGLLNLSIPLIPFILSFIECVFVVDVRFEWWRELSNLSKVSRERPSALGGPGLGQRSRCSGFPGAERAGAS